MEEIIHSIFHRRHFWRHVRMSELSELYISISLRVLGLSLIGIFIPVYFYQQGISLTTIALFFAGYHSLRLLVDPISGKLVSKYGPKHILRFSFIVEIFYLLSVVGVGNGYVPIWLAMVMNAFAFSFFYIPFHIDFSTVQSAKKVGSQMSVLSIVQQTAGAIGPLAGGLLATMYSFELTLFIALFVTLLASIPLLLNGEIKSLKEYKYRFSFKNYGYFKGEDFLTYMGHGFNIAATQIFWPLFTAVAIFSTSAYAGVGLVKAVGLGAAIISAHAIGKIVDNKRGRELMRYATLAQGIGHIIKPLIATSTGAIVVSLATEPMYIAIDIPWSKGHYDRIDSSKVGRTAYTVSALAVLHFARILGYSFLALATLYLNDVDALAVSIFAIGLGTLLMLSENFKALD